MRKSILLILMMVCISNLLAQDWEIQKQWLEPVYSVNIESVTFLNADLGWLTGRDGFLYKTTDGGDNWTLLRNADHDIDWNDIKFINANTGYATGDDGFLFKTSDGGDTWTMIADTATYQVDFNCLEVISEDLAFFTGDDGVLLKTTDGGETYAMSSAEFYDVDLDGGITFINENLGLLASNDFGGGMVWYTHDGGESWVFNNIAGEYPDVSYKRPLSIDSGDDSTFVVTGYHKATFISKDGGVSFSRVGNFDSGTVKNDVVSMIDGNTFFLVNKEENILRTDNGGVSFDTLSYGTGQYVKDMLFIDEDTGFVITGFGHWLKTTDGGQSFHPLQPWPEIYLRSITSPSDDKLIITAFGGGELSLSNDGGISFSYPTNYSTNFFGTIADCQFVDENNGLIVGDDNFCALTTDGGVTWNTVTHEFDSENIIDFNTIEYITESIVYIAGDDGVIYKSNDAGETWTFIENEGDEDILDLWCFDENNIKAYADNGKIYAQLDAATTFSVHDSIYQEEDINAVTFHNGKGLYACDKGIIMVKTDTDTAKVLFENDTGDDIFAIDYLSDNYIYALGEDGWAYYSDDAGETWTTESAVDEINLYDFTYVNGTIWAVGNDGLILKKEIGPVTTDSPNKNVSAFKLEQNYPNPFNPITTINYSIPVRSDVTLVVYNMAGQKVKEMNRQSVTPGHYQFTFDGRQLASGIYFYQIKAGDFSQVRKMTLIK